MTPIRASCPCVCCWAVQRASPPISAMCAIKDMVVIQFILQAGNIMSIGFEKAYALQTDLNLNSAEIIATYVYKKGLLDGDYSFSTAVGLFNTVINVILLIAVNKIVAKMNDGQGL